MNPALRRLLRLRYHNRLVTWLERQGWHVMASAGSAAFPPSARPASASLRLRLRLHRWWLRQGKGWRTEMWDGRLLAIVDSEDI